MENSLGRGKTAAMAGGRVQRTDAHKMSVPQSGSAMHGHPSRPSLGSGDVPSTSSSSGVKVPTMAERVTGQSAALRASPVPRSGSAAQQQGSVLAQGAPTTVVQQQLHAEGLLRAAMGGSGKVDVQSSQSAPPTVLPGSPQLQYVNARARAVDGSPSSGKSPSGYFSFQGASPTNSTNQYRSGALMGPPTGTSASGPGVAVGMAAPGIAPSGLSRLGGSQPSGSSSAVEGFPDDVQRGVVVTNGRKMGKGARGASASASTASNETKHPAWLTAVAGVAGPAASHETRIANMEACVKKCDQMLKDYTPAENTAENTDLSKAIQQCDALASELAMQRTSRRALEEKAKQLDKLLRHERGEREAWLVAFLTSLHTTLQELTGCIDRSISDSNNLMKDSMNGTDEAMHQLIDRVDQLLIEKESELAPLMEQEEVEDK